MKRIETWSLPQIAEAMGGRYAAGSEERGVKGVSTDTRRIFEGALFVALVGENFDGHRFIVDAARAGAAAAVVSTEVDAPEGFPLIIVDDTLVALSRLGHALWREATDAGLRTVAVTGSNGKTTTKELLAALWATQGRVWATQGNLNNHIGVPLTLADLPLQCDTLIAEMGANTPGDIAHLIAFAPGQLRIVTSIGYAHIEKLGSLDGVRRTKGEIFDGADAGTAAIVPFEERAHLLPGNYPGPVWTVGREAGARVRVTEAISDGAGRQQVTVEVDSRKWALSLPLPGVHNAVNLATALATLLAAGLDPDETSLDDALDGLTLPQGRWRVVQLGELSIIDDAYNANPSSVRASFEAFVELTEPGRKLAVVGELRELGPEAERLHADLAKALATRGGVHGLAFVGPFGRVMAGAAEALDANMEIKAFETTEDVVSWLEEQGAASVLLKASRGSRLERIITGLEESLSRS
jgi:UDP-N-acetylmuramoyl-tripeptide--D-alanyl-D-alanine ligase